VWGWRGSALGRSGALAVVAEVGRVCALELLATCGGARGLVAGVARG